MKRDAKEDEIRKAHKRLKKELDPEKNPGDEEKYMIYEKLDRALFVLTDAPRRSIYTNSGLAELEKQERIASD